MEAGSDAGEIHLERQEWLRHFSREFIFKLDLIDLIGKGTGKCFWSIAGFGLGLEILRVHLQG